MPIVQFHVATGTPDCWKNVVKDVCRFRSSRLKSSTTSSDTKGLPQDFSLWTLPVRTNLLITSLMWPSNDVSWIIKSRCLARYSCLQVVTEYTNSSFTKSHCRTRHNKESVLFYWINHFHSLRFLTHLKNVKTRKTPTLWQVTNDINDKWEVTYWGIISAKRDFWNP